MSTSDVIEYEVSVLEAMNTESLLLQLIARKDLDRPKRPAQLKASLVFDQACKSLEAAIASVEAVGVPSVTSALQGALNDYKQSVEEST